MLRENRYILRQANIAFDLALSVAAFLISHLARQGLHDLLPPGWLETASLRNYIWLLPVAPVATILALAWNGVYQDQRMRLGPRGQVRRMAAACFEAMLLLMAVVVLLPPETRTSRSFILILPFTTFALIFGKSLLVHRLLLRIRRRTNNLRRAILVGSGEALERFAGMLAGYPTWGLRVIGVVTDRPELQGVAFPAVASGGMEWAAGGAAAPPAGALTEAQLPILGDLTHAADLLWRTPIDEVILVPGAATLGQLHPLLEVCEEMGVRTHLPLLFFPGRIAHPEMDLFGGIPVLSWWPTRTIGPALVFKYAFDRMAALALLVLALPVSLAAVLAIRLTSRRGEPVFFGQIRCGLNGRLFTCWKLRSMSVGAEERLAELEGRNEQDGPAFKMRDDPRVTAVGRWLRRFSIDEIPQLWNVLRGEMSLVGPRPPLPEEVARYDRWQRRRLSMKPGITCLWQVMGRNTLPFETWMKLDLQYIDNWSLGLDFKILIRTVYAVFSGYGAS
ncbi:MAG: sugar transferase [bacterium]|nr:sugar transferase [bacterium]